MKLQLLIFSFALTFLSCKQNLLPSVPEQLNHHNHKVFEENKLPPRATFFGFENKLKPDKEISRRFLCLNGDWKFNFVKYPRVRPSSFQN
ncbi:MAG: hypothetical protein RIB64_14050, partial [Arenibacter algicola]